MHQKKPLYRKVNTKTHGVRHNSGGKAKWDRNTKDSRKKGGSKQSMGGRKQRGLDYTPLYKFLISRVGHDWDETYSEAKSRLDREGAEKAIFWIIPQDELEPRPLIRTGESSYYSGLFIDDDNILQRIDPDMTIDDLFPSCNCCTHTFNGNVYTNKHPGYELPVTDATSDAMKPKD
jgi:hypothetical protein